MSLVGSDEEIVQKTLAAEPLLVSIDSPLSLPAGRSSEFDDDPGREEYGIIREAERQLRKRGVHVYPALLPSMQRLTQRGIRLAARPQKERYSRNRELSRRRAGYIGEYRGRRQV